MTDLPRVRTVPAEHPEWACSSTYEGRRCCRFPGVDAHELRRVERSGLGLPILLHKSACGREWTSAMVLAATGGALAADTSDSGSDAAMVPVSSDVDSVSPGAIVNEPTPAPG